MNKILLPLVACITISCNQRPGNVERSLNDPARFKEIPFLQDSSSLVLISIDRLGFTYKPPLIHVLMDTVDPTRKILLVKDSARSFVIHLVGETSNFQFESNNPTPIEIKGLEKFSDIKSENIRTIFPFRIMVTRTTAAHTELHEGSLTAVLTNMVDSATHLSPDLSFYFRDIRFY